MAASCGSAGTTASGLRSPVGAPPVAPFVPDHRSALSASLARRLRTEGIILARWLFSSDFSTGSLGFVPISHVISVERRRNCADQQHSEYHGPFPVQSRAWLDKFHKETLVICDINRDITRYLSLVKSRSLCKWRENFTVPYLPPYHREMSSPLHSKEPFFFHRYCRYNLEQNYVKSKVGMFLMVCYIYLLPKIF